MGNVLLLLVLIPLIAAIVLLFIPARCTPLFRGIALVATVLTAILSLTLYLSFNHGNTLLQFPFALNWLTVPNAFGPLTLTIAFAFGTDGISMPLLVLVGVISVMAVIRNMTIRLRVKSHFFWMLLLVSGLYGVFAAADLFTFFFFLETTLVSTFFLIHIWGNERRQYAATKFLIYRGVASVVLLAALIGIAYAYANQAEVASASVFLPNAPNFLTLSMSQLLDTAGRIQLSGSVQNALFLVLLLAVLIEEAFVPFHTWLPDTHEQSDTGTNMLIGGALMKIGLYVLIRFGVELLPLGLKHYALLVGVLGVISILYAAFVAFAERDWRRLIAFSSISHMGLVLLAIASLQAIGLQGAVFMLVSSGLLTALMFFTVGAQADRTKTYSITQLGGISKSLPVLSGVMLVAALGLVGLPGMSGFISEFSLFVGSFMTFPVLATLGTLGMILAALYLLFAMQRTTFGPTQPDFVGLTDAHAVEYVPLVVLVVLVIGIGVYPNVIGSVVHGTVQAITARIGG